MSRLPDHLLITLGSEVIGEVIALRQGGYRFEYRDSWRDRRYAIPLSLSMPMTRKSHPDELIRNFMWNLLPDNPRVLSQWAKTHQVSPNNPYALLAQIGQDCAGAVRFFREEAIDRISEGGVRWIDEAEVGERLRQLRANAAATRFEDDTGQFSLAGAQSKTALLYQAGRWGVPSGAVPTTHILKPPLADREAFSEVEHFCMRLSKATGLVTAHTELGHFGSETAIVVERYDRRDVSGRIVRVHQEDFCQALGVHPDWKYQNGGGQGGQGPGVCDLMQVLENHGTHAALDRDRLFKALAFNFVIAGTDAHAKNFSLLHSHRGVRLAPLYDLASFIPYAAGQMPKTKLAMSIGGHYRLADIVPRHWAREALRCGYAPETAVGHVRDLIARVPDLASQVLSHCRAQGLGTPVLPGLVDRLADRCKRLSLSYGSEGAPVPDEGVGVGEDDADGPLP